MSKTQRERAVVDLVINGQQSKATLKEIGTAAVNARKELNRMVEADNPEAYARKLREVQKLTQAQRDHAARINDVSTGWSRFMKNMGTMVPSVAAGTLIAGGVQTIIGLLPQAIDKSIQFKDELADIAKAADMTDAEVDDLNKRLASIDTRTPTRELRAIAEIGGQFGVPKEKLAEFTEGMNQLNVAIGKDFGGVENLSKDMTAVRNIFTNIKTDAIDQDLLRIGNAFNVLEAAGAATSPVMADFSSRMGGTLIPLGLSEAQILGYSATLQELNVTAERGSTAVVDIFQKMLTETSTFAKVAGMDLKDYKKLISTDMNAAFLAYLQGLKKVQGNQIEFAGVLEASKLTGSGVMEVLSKLSVNSEMLAEKTDMAGKALQNTDSITAEYSKKNFELAVNMKKITEWFDSFMTSPAVMGFAEWITGATVKMIGLGDAVGDINKKYDDQKKRVESLGKPFETLLQRHDQLLMKTSRTKEEQNELNGIVGKIAETVPQAITQFDNYGRAMAANTQKARDAVRVQQELLQYYNKSAIEETKNSRNQEMLRRAQLQRELNSSTVMVGPAGPGGIPTTRKLTADEIRAKQAELNNLSTEINRKTDLLKGLGYNDPTPSTPSRGSMTSAPEVKTPDEKPGDKPGTGNKPGTGTISGVGKPDKKGETAAEKLKREAQELERLMSEARQRSLKNADDDYEAALLQFGDRYSKMIQLAGQNQAKLNEIGSLMDDELKTITEKYDQKERERQTRILKEQLDDAETVLESEKRIRQTLVADQITAGAIQQEQARVLELEAEEQYLMAKLMLQKGYYDSLADLAGDDAEESARINRERNAAIGETEAQLSGILSEQYAARTAQRRAEQDQHFELMQERARWVQEEMQFRRQMLNDLSGLLMNSWGETLAGYKKFWRDTTIIQKAAFLAQRAFALAEVAINLSRQISAVNVAASLANAIAPGSGAIVRLKGYITASAVAAVQTAKILATSPSIPSFEAGGYTAGDKIYESGGRRFRAGERGTEFIMSNPMLRNPVMADLARILNTLQITGAYKQLGYAGQNASAPSVHVDQAQVVAELQALAKRVDSLADRPVNWNYLAFEKVKDRVDYINDVTTI
ncbi:phage tail tape measure protein [Rudanella paleaurantiibacter]|uniref:Phage tail tape measure protein n=1 Tax=Rudanella paleaurantiibacter TaxID=2614655 RepID=A0A7J5TVD2_9BACT|nr:phage tail tape measure protein [Rudanella paleaurantiibacter]KAB7728118.1 phage tail tape measure protein [Rudanella paleaurantiibacter]